MTNAITAELTTVYTHSGKRTHFTTSYVAPEFYGQSAGTTLCGKYAVGLATNGRELWDACPKCSKIAAE